MKKSKLLLATLCVASVGALACGLAACGEHEHDYDLTKWVSVDNEYHAHPCKVEGCKKVTGNEKHDEKTEVTATCTEDGETITTCAVEGCPYEVKTSTQKLGHDWDYDNPVQEQTHLQGAIYNCKREGCNETSDEGEPIPHDYEWTAVDVETHSGVCKDSGCASIPAVVEEHNFTTSSSGNFTLYTCDDCKSEYAEVRLYIHERISATQTRAYTGANIKVALYKIGGENDAPDYEATVDSETSVATLKIAEGAYWIKVTDEENGYLSAEANYIRFIKSSAESDPTSCDIILSEAAEYKVKFTYGASTPATGINVQVYPNYRYNGVTAPVLDEGVTDENGEVSFTLASSFDMAKADNCGLRVTGYNQDEYKPLAGLGLAATDKEATKAFVFEPKQQAFTIKVKAGDDYISGFTVKFFEQQYDAETETWNKAITSTLVAEGDSVVTEVMENVSKQFYIEIPDEYKDDWAVPTLTVIDPETKEEHEEIVSYTTNTKTGETVVELKASIKIITYKITVSSRKGVTDKSTLTVAIKNSDGEVVASGTPTKAGSYAVDLPSATYTAEIISGLPEGVTVSSIVYEDNIIKIYLSS